METNTGVEQQQEHLDFVPVWSYDNYVPAHIDMGVLEEMEIPCYLKDENTVTMNPLWTNAVGGVKLMVLRERAKEAYDILKSLRDEYKKTRPCPSCGSTDMELVSTPRKPTTWLTAFVTFFTTDYAMTADKVYHCFNCKKEFPENQFDNEIATGTTGHD